jgi:hypothetical protein
MGLIRSGKDLMVMDEKGGTAKVTIADVMQSNGVILFSEPIGEPRWSESVAQDRIDALNVVLWTAI